MQNVLKITKQVNRLVIGDTSPRAVLRVDRPEVRILTRGVQGPAGRDGENGTNGQDGQSSLEGVIIDGGNF